MTNLEQSAKELHISLEKTKNEIELLARSIDLKRIEFTEVTSKQLGALDTRIKSLEKETVLLHELPKKLSTQIEEIIPHIAIELNKLNQNEIKNLITVHANSVEEQNKAVKDAAARLNQIKEEIEKIDGKRIKRYFLGLVVIVMISVLASLGATYVMIKMFPQHIQIQSPNNIAIQKSDVSLWSSNNVHISGDVKKRGR